MFPPLSEVPYKRIGECNRCGQCCGADGSPNQANPYPSHYLMRRRNSDIRRSMELIPQLEMCGLTTNENGTPRLEKDNGKTIVTMEDGTEREFYWIWHDGVPCKADSDGQFKSLECPFLIGNPGDDTRDCGLIGSNREDAYRTFCFRDSPPLKSNKVRIQQWHKDHPKCKPSEENNWTGFDWIEWVEVE